MNQGDLAPAPGGPDPGSLGIPLLPGEPSPLDQSPQGWARWASLAISAAVLVAIGLAFRRLDFREVEALFPTSIAFWAVFVACYFSPAIGDWLVYRRLWKIPPAGAAALIRKLVSNEVLLGYSGEVYFYTWARRRAEVAAAPFGAIKDVAILSAVAGNGLTLVLVVLVWPLIPRFALGGSAVDWSVLAVAVMSFAIVIFQRRLLSLPARELRIIFMIHLVRICITTGLGMLLWHLALPSVALGMWAVLGAFKLLLSRLPLLPNKDMAFAGLAVVLVGRGVDVSAVVAMVATLMLMAHLLVGSLLAVGEFTDAELLR